MFAISSLLPPIPRLKIVDVGAMKVGEGVEPYAALLKAVPCEVIGFEPVAAEFEKLNTSRDSARSYLPFFIGDGSTRTFHECNFPMCSSLFEPNTPLLAKFQNLEELVRVTKTSQVETKRLDDIPEIAGADFLKIDVQGGELLVFQGAMQTLKDALVIETEVEFVALYKDQPLFADIDAFLRAQGFQFHQLATTAGRAFRSLIFNNNVDAPTSQWLWGDAVYVRDFMAFGGMTPVSLLKLAVILHENYRSVDLAASALEAYDRLTGSRLQVAYSHKLTSPA